MIDLNKGEERVGQASRRGRPARRGTREHEREISALRAEIARLRAAREPGTSAREERMKMLGETAAAIAHEVRNPLGSIALFVSMLKEDLGDPTHQELLTHIEKSVETLNHVVTNILHFAKDKPLSLAPVNLHSILREQVALLAPRMKGQSPAIELSGNPFIRAEDHALRQVFSNLLINAGQATSFLGEVRVSCRDVEEGVEVKIIDSGPGVPEELRERIFEPFVTTRKEGTGLGLSIVREIIIRHGGTVNVTQEGGAAFVIRLPRR